MRKIYFRKFSDLRTVLSKITVNQFIWDRVSAEARTGDVKMQRVQSALVKGPTNVALIADLVLKSYEDKDNIDITASNF